MKTLLLAAALALPALASAAPKTYQVTGPVLAIDGGVVTVQKGTDKWEIAADKLPVGLKVGDKVTITYVMSAKDIEVKAEKAAAKPAKKK